MLVKRREVKKTKGSEKKKISQKRKHSKTKRNKRNTCLSKCLLSFRLSLFVHCTSDTVLHN